MARLPFSERQELKRLSIVPWKVDGGDEKIEPIEVVYNPKEYTLEHSNSYAEIGIPGLAAPIVQFVRGNTEKLSLDLLIDTTDKELGSEGRNAGDIVDKIVRLAEIEGSRHAPPVVKFQWAKLQLDGVIETVRRQFVLFDPDGTPTRVNVTLGVKRYRTLVDQLGKMNLQSPDRTRTVVVEQGDTLPLIASRAYGDDREWRPIARANGIVDPGRLAPGTLLRIPVMEETS